MSEYDQATFRGAYDMVRRETEELQSRLAAQLGALSTEQFPMNTTRLRCLIDGLGGVAAMAATAAEHVTEESTRS